jgi:hypothetical protein
LPEQSKSQKISQFVLCVQQPEANGLRSNAPLIRKKPLRASGDNLFLQHEPIQTEMTGLAEITVLPGGSQ